MKELSIEQKAQRYDEAIEIAKEINNEQQAQPFNIMTRVFPELKESEDEKMIQYFKDLAPFDKADELYEKYGFSHKDAIAWLEKKGEKTSDKGESNLLTVERAKEMSPFMRSGFEQEPADRVEPKFKVGDIVKHKDNPHLTYILKRFTNDGDYEFHAIGKDGNEGCTHFAAVKCQDDWELVEHNPAWSEEEVEIIDWLVASFDCLKIPTGIFYQSKVRPFLISLRNKIQPIINEWSEEDETTKNNISHIIRQYDKISKKENQPCSYIGDCLLWMLNIKDRVQPQTTWKPSDEQMKQLGLVAKQNKDNALGKELTTLYEQLKAL